MLNLGDDPKYPISKKKTKISFLKRDHKHQHDTHTSHEYPNLCTIITKNY